MKNSLFITWLHHFVVEFNSTFFHFTPNSVSVNPVSNHSQLTTPLFRSEAFLGIVCRVYQFTRCDDIQVNVLFCLCFICFVCVFVVVCARYYVSITSFICMFYCTHFFCNVWKIIPSDSSDCKVLINQQPPSLSQNLLWDDYFMFFFLFLHVTCTRT